MGLSNHGGLGSLDCFNTTIHQVKVMHLLVALLI